MKKLIIINSLSVFDQENRKNGLYPTLIKMHEKAGIKADLLSLDFPSEELVNQYKEIVKSVALINIPKNYTNRFYSVICELLSRVFDGPKTKNLYYQIKYFLHFRAIKKQVEKQGSYSSIVSLTSCEDAGIFSFMLNQAYKTPYIIMEHRTHYARMSFRKSQAKIIKNTLSNAKIILPVSVQLGDQINDFVEGKANIIPMPNPAPMSIFEIPSKEKLTEVVTFASGRFIFAGWTNWRQIKRLDVAIKAFEKVLSKNKDICLVVAGPVGQNDKDYVHQKSLSGQVLFLGSLSREKIHLLAHSIDCCVVPSDFETFGLPVIESLAAGRPAVVTRCGGPESIIVNKRLGRTVDKGDIDGFAVAMEEILNMRSDFDAEWIKKYCLEHYSEDALVDRWKRIYEGM